MTKHKHGWKLSKDYNFDNSQMDYKEFTCVHCKLRKRMYIKDFRSKWIYFPDVGKTNIKNEKNTTKR